MFINLRFDEIASPPSEVYPRVIDSHILGLILANQYNLKRVQTYLEKLPMRL